MHGEYEQHCERLHRIRGWNGMGCVSVVWPGIATMEQNLSLEFTQECKGMYNEEHQYEGKKKKLLLRKIKHFV